MLGYSLHPRGNKFWNLFQAIGNFLMEQQYFRHNQLLDKSMEQGSRLGGSREASAGVGGKFDG